MNRKSQWAACVLFSLAAVAPLADQGPSKSALLCAITHTVSCDDEGECTQGPATAVNLPVFMDFRLAEKKVRSASAAGSRRTSSIGNMEFGEEVIVLQGGEKGVGWSATIRRADGALTGAIAADGTGYLIFGACLEHDTGE